MATPARTALREGTGAAAAILGGTFIIATVNDPAAPIIAVLPIALGLQWSAGCLSTLRTIRTARRQSGTGTGTRAAV